MISLLITIFILCLFVWVLLKLINEVENDIAEKITDLLERKTRDYDNIAKEKQ